MELYLNYNWNHKSHRLFRLWFTYMKEREINTVRFKMNRELEFMVSYESIAFRVFASVSMAKSSKSSYGLKRKLVEKNEMRAFPLSPYWTHNPISRSVPHLSEYHYCCMVMECYVVVVVVCSTFPLPILDDYFQLPAGNQKKRNQKLAIFRWWRGLNYDGFSSVKYRIRIQSN